MIGGIFWTQPGSLSFLDEYEATGIEAHKFLCILVYALFIVSLRTGRDCLRVVWRLSVSQQWRCALG